MSMKPEPIPEIPSETVRVVHAAFPKGNLYIWLRNALGTIYQDELFADLYPGRGQPAYAPWRLASEGVAGGTGGSNRQRLPMASTGTERLCFK